MMGVDIKSLSFQINVILKDLLATKEQQDDLLNLFERHISGHNKPRSLPLSGDKRIINIWIINIFQDNKIT